MVCMTLLHHGTDGLPLALSLTPCLVRNPSPTDGLSVRDISPLYEAVIVVPGSPIGLYPIFCYYTGDFLRYKLCHHAPSNLRCGEKHARHVTRLVFLRPRFVSCEGRDDVILSSATCDEQLPKTISTAGFVHGSTVFSLYSPP